MYIYRFSSIYVDVTRTCQYSLKDYYWALSLYEAPNKCCINN